MTTRPRPTASLEGRVLSARTGRAAPRMVLGAARRASLLELPPEQPAPLEMFAASEEDGSFRFEADAAMPGIEQMIVFGTSPFYACLTPEGAALPPGQPSVGDLLAAGLQPRNALEGAAVDLVLQPVVEHEPYTERAAMSDGSRLATMIFLPDGDGPWPTVLVRTPYGRFAYHGLVAGAVQAGYAAAVQDHRGRFDSEGENVAFIGCGWGEHRDGYETVEWVAGQPWCNGKVATLGGSAMGITQYLLAPTAPPHLVCQVIAVATPDLSAQADYPGGMFRKEQVEEWLRNCGFDETNLELLRGHYVRDEWTDLFDALRPDRVAQVRVPGLHIGGWFDTFQQGPLDGYRSRQHGGGEGARGTQRLILGPWTHGVGGRVAGEVEWPENAAVDVWRETLRFLDYWMKGQDDGLGDEPPVRYYLMGAVGEEDAPGREWIAAEDWPPPAEPMPLYLRAGGELLPETATSREGHETLRHDPFYPVPSHGGFNLNIPSGPMDQHVLEQRKDVLVWTSPPLDAPLEVAGPVRARLWVSSNCLDTDFVVKLCDVYPDGRSMLVTYGGLRMRFRNGRDREELLEVDEVYEVEVDLWSTAHVFAAGHRVRVDVQSSDYPHFDINPGSGEALHQHTFVLAALNRVYMGPDRPSRIVLPVTSEDGR